MNTYLSLEYSHRDEFTEVGHELRTPHALVEHVLKNYTEPGDRGLDISLTTLSDRLAELCEAGILDRKSHDEIPPRVEYRPTEKGRALRPVLEAVADWIDEYET